MKTRARRAARPTASQSVAVVVLVAAAASAASASASIAAPPIGPASQLATLCATTLKLPQLLLPSPVVLPDVVWHSRSVVRASVSFRLDRQGRPTNVLASVSGLDKDAKPIFERTVADAFKRHQFCPAGDFSTTLNWSARLVFSPADDAEEDGNLYLQSFMPGYGGFGRAEKHEGRVVVRATYGGDGRPRSVQLVESSGDKLLDDKSLDAMSSAQVLFRNGIAPSKPISIERPFTYQP